MVICYGIFSKLLYTIVIMVPSQSVRVPACAQNDHALGRLCVYTVSKYIVIHII